MPAEAGLAICAATAAKDSDISNIYGFIVGEAIPFGSGQVFRLVQKIKCVNGMGMGREGGAKRDDFKP
jgi:hypothetical protein